MSDTVIKAENLGKSYIIGHEKRERYTALRDVIARKTKQIVSKTRQVLKGGQLILGQEMEEFWALKELNFEIKQGDRVGIIGRNGAGKTTLLKILSRITEPTTGMVQIKGRVASLLEVGTGFHPELSGRENIYLNGAILGMSRAEVKRKFDEIVDFSGVEKFLDTPVKRFSSGMQVRLGFAVAAHLEPEILVVDEVLAVGDAEFQKKCLGKMEDVSTKEGRTVLFVSHNMSTVSTLCQKGIYLKSGIISYSGLIQNTIAKYLSEDSYGRTKIIWDEDKRPGDEVASLISARLIDENFQDIISADISQKIGIEYIYEVKEDGNTRIPNVHIYTSRGECAFMSGDKEDLKYKRKGVFKALMWIPANLLNVDTYIVGIALTTITPEKVHFWVKNALFFETNEDLLKRNNEYNQVIPGIVRPILNWDTQIIN